MIMKPIQITILLSIASLFTACVQIPETVEFNGRDIPNLSPFSIGCNKPYVLDQDCSSLTGATRKIEFEGNRARIAGSADGTTVFIMADKTIGFDSMRITVVASAIEEYLTARGFTVVERKASAMPEEVAAFFLVFDGDAYSVLKEFTVES